MCAACTQVLRSNRDASRVVYSERLPDSGVAQEGVNNHNSDVVPRCVMNPAYEYALPTQVAHLMALRETETDEEGSADIKNLKMGSREDLYAKKGRVLAGSLVKGISPGEQASCPTVLDHMPAARDTGTVVQAPAQLSSWLSETALLPPPPAQLEEGSDCGRLACARGTVGMLDTTGCSAQDWAGLQQPRTEKQVLPGMADVRSEQGVAAATATGDHVMTCLQRQLDKFQEDDVFLERFQMFGRQHRRRGGAWPSNAGGGRTHHACATGS